MRTRSKTNGCGLYDLYIEQTIPSFHLCSYSDMCCDRPTASLWLRTHKPIRVVFSSASPHAQAFWLAYKMPPNPLVDIAENELTVHSTEPIQSRGSVNTGSLTRCRNGPIRRVSRLRTCVPIRWTKTQFPYRTNWKKTWVEKSSWQTF